jgi:RNA polymerase sigma factor (TIGR02999 family)
VSSDRAAVTQVLDALGRGDPRAARELLPLVYDELRRLAARRVAGERPGQTLQATALVHEAYLRLVGPDSDRSWNDRGHFYAAAAEAMRRILIDRARDRGRLKRGGAGARLAYRLEEILDDGVPADDLIALDEALARLACRHGVAAQVAKLRLFAGLAPEEAAAAAGLCRRTSDRAWAFARAWLFDALNPPEAASAP